MKNYKTLLAVLAAGAALTSAQAQAVRELTVDASKPQKGIAVQPTMYGIFFEDINYGADGGLYAEMVKNRSFEFPQKFMGWDTFGKVELRTDNPAFDRNPTYVRLSWPGHRERRTGLQNEGFFGMAVKKGAAYDFSTWARVPADGGQGEKKIRVELVNTHNDVIASQEVAVNGSQWAKVTATLTPSQDMQGGKLRLFYLSDGAVDLDHISLFPADTWKGRPGGMRKDLVQALSDLKPGVFRFPGGCIVEGIDLASRYQWKNSVGPVENRPLNENRWNYTFAHRNSPDYYQTYGLGFFEYFQLAEDIGAEPLPILNCGLACQYQTNNETGWVPLDELQPYIDDALDLIEFANGDASTEWGKVRADMGHPEPFGLKFVGIGNEQWGKVYPERLELFVKAIREAYPDIQIVGSSGPQASGEDFDYLWPEMKRLKVDLVDEHYYRPADWFLNNARRYDNYDRKGPKVFAGEYACHAQTPNSFESALCEAAFMTGLERNADVVPMATYAPLFAHVDGWQWRPDLIWFDNLRSVRSINYYVQQLYSYNKGTNVLKLTENKQTLAGEGGLYASAVYDAAEEAFIVKIANVSDQAQPLKITFKGQKQFSKGTVTLLHADDQQIVNTLDAPGNVLPQTGVAYAEGNVYETTLGAKTFAVYKFVK